MCGRSAGMGDPSGQGLAMSYLKNMKRLGKDPVNRILGKQDGAAAIMGTASDLRKLPNKQARANHRICLLYTSPKPTRPY